MLHKWLSVAMNYPRRVMAVVGVLVVLALLQFPRMAVDTDPENMLPASAPVRVFDRAVKKEFALYDQIVLGVVNREDPDGVFNVSTLKKIYDLTGRIKEIPGVMPYELVSFSTKDNVLQDGIGAVRFTWLMEEPPTTREEALAIRAEAEDHPMFRGSVVSEDGQMLALYIPLEKKSLSYEVAQAVRKILKEEQGPEEYHITGLPVAEDQFGVEMFKQMAISAPLAGLVIFL
ncbi:MAG: RND transporter, partial [Elusimicrobia bacterium]|nr:RND transporter [Elusimicrobiota bacterium]